MGRSKRMPRPARMTLALFAFYILTSAVSAHAECAWVLWRVESRMEYPGDVTLTRHFTEAAYPAHPDCQAAAVRMTKVYYDFHAKLGVAAELKYTPGATFFAYRSAGREGQAADSRTYDLQCWPDTIDPRGPMKK